MRIHQQDLDYRICMRCGLVFLAGPPSEGEIQRFYEVGYRTTQQGTEQPTEEKLRFERKRAEFQARLIRRFVQAGSHLDIGCAGGELIKAVAARRSFGVEPGVAYRGYLGRVGVLAYADLASFLDAHRGVRVQLVTMSLVLEHLPRPMEFLRLVRNVVLQADGLLYVEVPNLLVHTSYEPGHLLAFQTRSLRYVLERAAFRVLHVLCHARPREDPRGHYISMIAVCGSETDRPPAYVAPRALLLARWWARSKLGAAASHPLWFLKRWTSAFW